MQAPHVMSIIGPSRIGKSTLLSFLFGGSVKFKVSGDANVPCTEGILANNKLIRYKKNDYLILDCQGFDNTHNIDIKEKNQKEKLEVKDVGTLTKKEDIMFLCYLTLNSNVIVYYYTQTVEQTALNDLEDTCKLLSEWKESYPDLAKSQKTKLIFLRRNGDDDTALVFP